MLIHNGFVCEKNPNNTFKLRLGISLQDPLFHQRSALLSQIGINATENFEISSNLEIPLDAFIFVRVFLFKTGKYLAY